MSTGDFDRGGAGAAERALALEIEAFLARGCADADPTGRTQCRKREDEWWR